MSKGQEDIKPQELTSADKKFIELFDHVTESTIGEFERNQREKINNASKEVRTAFDEVWRKIVGSPYYQPITVQAAPQKTKSPRMDPKSNGYEGYYEVVFASRQNPNEPEEVMLGVNGLCLQIKREIPVVLPGMFLEVADNANHPKFTQLPGVERKITGYIKIFPYTVLRQAEEDEYASMLADGNRLTKQARQREEQA